MGDDKIWLKYIKYGQRRLGITQTWMVAQVEGSVCLNSAMPETQLCKLLYFFLGLILIK